MSQSEGAAHVSWKAQWQELERDGHILSVIWGAEGEATDGVRTAFSFSFTQAIRVGLLSSADPI